MACGNTAVTVVVFQKLIFYSVTVLVLWRGIFYYTEHPVRCRVRRVFFGNLFTVSSSAAAELDELDSCMASSDTSNDILAFWWDNSAVWPKLSAVVRCILAIPATDTSSERVFSLADGGTVEERQTQLSADAVDVDI